MAPEDTPAPQRVPFSIHIPFVESIGVELHRHPDGRVEVQLPLQDHLTNSWQVAHGGVVMTVLDVAMAQAARAAHPEGHTGMATIEMKTSFLRPAAGRLSATGSVLRRTRNMAFCEATLRDGDGHLCAHATGTFKYVTALVTPDGQARTQTRRALTDG
ncbi:MAG: PaaI family thioesterase [Aquabacterium sp.]